MGYTTEFSGKLTIDPPLDMDLIEKINEFCEERHGGPADIFPGIPGFWCDWKVGEDGDKIYWNGSEKSYNMDKWLELLIKEFIAPAGSVVSGRLLAQGEERNDVWLLVADKNRVARLEMNLGSVGLFTE